MTKGVGFFKWLWPGLGLKRCLTLGLLGIASLCLGLTLLTNNRYALDIEAGFIDLCQYLFDYRPSTFSVDIGFVVLGFIFLSIALYRAAYSLYSVTKANPGSSMINTIYRGGQPNYGLRIVTIGGGTGLSTLLRGLKKHTTNITAIVSVSDDGGSSGRLSKELGMLPPGDIRNCITALADDENLLTELFQYRFPEGQGLGGHSFGNLFIAALDGIYHDFEVALKKGSKMLAIRGRVLPATLAATTLCAKLRDGRIIKGESNIPKANGEVTDVFLEPSNCQAPPEVIKAIHEADAIILGPGSLYTSVMPNLLIKNITKALEQAEAPIIYVCNVMTQTGETDGYTAADHLQAIYHHVKKPLVDYIIVNVEPPHQLREKYEKVGAHPVKPDLARLRSMKVTPVPSNLVKEDQLVRHDPDFLAETIVDLLGQIKFKANEANSTI